MALATPVVKRDYRPEISKRRTSPEQKPYYSPEDVVKRIFFAINDYSTNQSDHNYVKCLHAIEYARSWYGDDRARQLYLAAQKRVDQYRATRGMERYVLPKLSDLKAKHLGPERAPYIEMNWEGFHTIADDAERMTWLDPFHYDVGSKGNYTVRQRRKAVFQAHRFAPAIDYIDVEVEANHDDTGNLRAWQEWEEEGDRNVRGYRELAYELQTYHALIWHFRRHRDDYIAEDIEPTINALKAYSHYVYWKVAHDLPEKPDFSEFEWVARGWIANNTNDTLHDDPSERGNSNRDILDITAFDQTELVAVDAEGNRIATTREPFHPIGWDLNFRGRARQHGPRFLDKVTAASPDDAIKHGLRMRLEAPLDVFFSIFRTRKEQQGELTFSITHLFAVAFEGKDLLQLDYEHTEGTMQGLIFKAFALAYWHDELSGSHYMEEVESYLAETCGLRTLARKARRIIKLQARATPTARDHQVMQSYYQGN